MASIIKVDELKEKTQGSGITLGHALKNSSGTEIMSAAGVFSSNIDGGTISNATLGSSVTFPAGHVIKSGQTILAQDGYTSPSNSLPTGFGNVVGPILLKNNDWIHVFINGGMAYGNQNNTTLSAYFGVNYKIDSTFSSADDGFFEQRFFFTASGDTGTTDDDYVTPSFVFYYQNTSGSDENFYYRAAHTSASSSTWNYTSTYTYIKTLYYVIQG